ncbi:MAG TPA: HD domain-containing protein [Spirochaetota bacterium]|nr:HD domain-containing protein [Spirochaetota bacterium]HPG51725.1 HD domain-containing protein [Spirochaetota bacterium]HPN13757.1 HD domain-containing protein [Spirochaetota bacterium]
MTDRPVNLNEIIQLSSELNTVQDLDLLLDKILTEARRILNADAASIQIKEGDELIFSHVQTESIQRLLPPGQKLIYTTFRTRISHGSISGHVALTGEILNIPDAYRIPADMPYQFDRTSDIKSNYHTKSMLTIPLINNRREVLGVMQILNSKNPGPGGGSCDGDGAFTGSFDASDEMFALHFANIASMILQRAKMTRALILRMISMAELRDPKETGPHVNRVAAYSVEIYEKWARARGLRKEEIDQKKDILRMAAMLHDVGKVAVSDLILKKPARFTPEEFEIMKTHTFQGARLFKFRESEFDEMSAEVALTHHENWDGTGYPGRVDVDTGEPLEKDSKGQAVPLKGEEIPIFGRIVALTDVFDALSSKRVYKEAWAPDDVLSEMRTMSGKKFDPELVEIFFESLDVIRSIAARYREEA